MITTKSELTFPCEYCGREVPESKVKTIDLSGPDEYYPDLRYYCPADYSDESGTEAGK